MIKTAYIICVEPNIKQYNNFSLHRALEARGISVEFFQLKNTSIDLNLSKVFSSLDEINLDEINFITENNVVTTSNKDLCLFSDPIFYMPESINIMRKLIIEKIKTFASTFVNDVDPHWHASNKIKMHTLLNNELVPTLRTLVLEEDTEEHLLTQVELLGGFPVVLKDPIDSLGRGIHLCKDINELKLNKSRITSKNKNSLAILQEFHDTSGVMICARVVGNRVWPRFTLGSPYIDNTFMANIGTGRAYFAHRKNEELEQLCVSATKAIGLDTARVDVFLSDDGYKVCEVNSIGSILGADIALNANVAAEIVDHAIKKSMG